MRSTTGSQMASLVEVLMMIKLPFMLLLVLLAVEVEEDRGSLADSKGIVIFVVNRVIRQLSVAPEIRTTTILVPMVVPMAHLVFQVMMETPTQPDSMVPAITARSLAT